MLCVVIKGPTYEAASQQILQALKYAQLIELRLDYFNSLDLVALKQLRTHFTLPMIFTLRSRQQGGEYSQSEPTRRATLRHLAALQPDYLDLESHLPPPFVHELTSRYPQVKLILSHHDFTATPDDLDQLYQKMCRIPATLYKIATTAQNTLDTLRLLCWAQRTKMIAVSMGAPGIFGRILSPIVGSPITYASLTDTQKSAPGQLTAQTLIERYAPLTPQTSLYGLIGDPIDLSVSDHTHNTAFQKSGIDAIYVKMQVSAPQLPQFLHLARQLPFRGLSVTMPLKESLLAYLHQIDPQAATIGAVNTLLICQGHLTGYNTDGYGALNAIERVAPVKGKQIVIIGAGGAARAIAFEALRRKANVLLLNRTLARAKHLAEHLHCHFAKLTDMPSSYDILINCTSAPMPIDLNDLLSNTLVMDIKTLPLRSPLLECAQQKGCHIIAGYHMFIEQALGQFALWFPDHPPLRTPLEAATLTALSSALSAQ